VWSIVILTLKLAAVSNERVDAKKNIPNAPVRDRFFMEIGAGWHASSPNAPDRGTVLSRRAWDAYQHFICSVRGINPTNNYKINIKTIFY